MNETRLARLRAAREMTKKGLLKGSPSRQAKALTKETIMHYKIDIDIDTTAFEGDIAFLELSRILLQLSTDVVKSAKINDHTPIHDLNGLRIGTAKLVEDHTESD